MSGDQQLLEVQAQRLERLLSTPDVQGGQVEEEEGGPTFEEAVSQLAEVRTAKQQQGAYATA